MNSTNKIIWAIIIIVVLAGGYYLLRGGYGNPYGNPTPTITPSGSPSQIINVAATTDFKFTPDTITVKSGEIVKINFINNGSAPHNFTIRNLNIATKTISSGQTNSIVFAAPAAGDYTFFCSIDGHEGLGMKGTLKVR